MEETKLFPLISAEEIRRMNMELGKQISRDYAGEVSEESALLLVVTLKGALFFAADLVRHLSIPVEIDFVRVTSYGSEKRSSGNVKILKDVDSVVENQHVLILDEIVDSGHTLSFLRSRLSAARPASLKVCALLSKPSRREVEVPIDYLGCEIEDKFLVGYGLDDREKYRNLPSIFYIN